MDSAGDNLIYSPLQENEIRLLVLLPGKEDDDIHCKLVESTLHTENEHDTATYEALSYMWGPPIPTTTIHVNDSLFMIRENLYNALKVLRYEHVPRCLWVDAICINQANDGERSAQVFIMSRVFRKARKVLVWLGEERDGSGILFDVLTKADGKIHLLEKMIGIWSRAGLDITTYSIPQIQASLLAVCRRSYWKRVWIIQEILSASSITLICGSKELLGLCFLCNSQCQDIHDRIFALVSLANNFRITPDYSITALELYIKIFQFLYFSPERRGLEDCHSTRNELDLHVQHLLDKQLWDNSNSCFANVPFENSLSSRTDLGIISDLVPLYRDSTISVTWPPTFPPKRFEKTSILKDAWN